MQKNIILLLITLCLSACSAAPQAELVVVPSVMAVTSETVVATPQPTPTVIPSETANPTLTATQEPVLLCSLFKGEDEVDLMNRISNPFYRPAPGSDNPHQGVDFSEYDPVNRYATSGKPVQALISGRVAMVVEDAFPFGNAIIIETAYDDLPLDWRIKLAGYLPVYRQAFHTNLSCFGDWENPSGDIERTSLYIMYAHFESPVRYELGDYINCGAEIGQIGMTGNALAPHVHVEMRVGPAGEVFEEMEHYDASASLTAMENYCRWRVSGWYHLLDPMEILFAESLP